MSYHDSVKTTVENFQKAREAFDATLKDTRGKFEAQVIGEKVKIDMDERAANNLKVEWDAAGQSVEDIRAQWHAAIDTWAQPKGSDVTDDSKLFGLGLKFGAKKLETMAKQYLNNPLMVQLIQRQAEAEGITIGVPGFFGEETRHNEANAYCDAARTALAHLMAGDGAINVALFLSDKYTGKSAYAEY